MKTTLRKKQIDFSLVISWVLLLSAVIVVVYLIIADPFNLSSKPYGAGDYYYTDLEGFQDIFLGETRIPMEKKHLLLFTLIFVGWSVFSCYLFLWLEKSKK